VKAWLVLLLISSGWAQVPCERADKKPCEFDSVRAAKIYYYVSAQVARTVNPSRPPKLLPKLSLKLGVSEVHFYISPESATIELPKWDEHMFSQAVAFAAASQILSVEETRQAAKMALVFVNATTSVEELKEGKR
jgi:hypothetical protein